MPRVLVIEDDADKLRRVLTCLQNVSGLERDMISNARDMSSAKQLLRDAQYDLLVLDIAVPDHSDTLPNHRAGLGLLEELLERDIYRMPAHIVGLTAHQDALAAARPKFEMDSLQIIHYDPASEGWADKLSRIARRIVLAEKQPGPVVSYGAHMCVITALATPELEAVLALPWNWKVTELPNDPSTYHRGTFDRDGKTCEVIAAAAPRMGMQASAVLATKMVMTFRPRYLAMTGILAGIEGQCQLGDIVAADPGWDYESGKRTIREGASTFAASPHQVAIDPFVRGKLVRMAQDRAVADEIRRAWPGTAQSALLSMRVGPVASGAAVLEDPTVVEEIRKQHRKTIGVEMETYGVLVAAEESPMPQPKAFSLKSVCDFADPRKNNDHQAYAAYTSAAALRIFAERYL